MTISPFSTNAPNFLTVETPSGENGGLLSPSLTGASMNRTQKTPEAFVSIQLEKVVFLYSQNKALYDRNT